MKRIICILTASLVLFLCGCNDNVTTQTKVDINSETLKETTEAPKEKKDTIKVGKTIEFGQYPQSDETGNQNDPIKWEVIDIRTNTNFDGTESQEVLLFSKKILDQRYYNDNFDILNDPLWGDPRYNMKKNISSTWNTSALRIWLNTDFYDNAFSDEEREKILETYVINDEENEHGISGGDSTDDKIFCLSINELRKYFGHEDSNGFNKKFKSSVTKYASNKGCSNSYWLRSPGSSVYYENAAWVAKDYLHNDHTGYLDSMFGVRPAMWVRLENSSSTNTQSSNNDSNVKLDEIYHENNDSWQNATEEYMKLARKSMGEAKFDATGKLWVKKQISISVGYTIYRQDGSKTEYYDPNEWNFGMRFAGADGSNMPTKNGEKVSFDEIDDIVNTFESMSDYHSKFCKKITTDSNNLNVLNNSLDKLGVYFYTEGNILHLTSNSIYNPILYRRDLNYNFSISDENVSWSLTDVNREEITKIIIDTDIYFDSDNSHSAVSLFGGFNYVEDIEGLEKLHIKGNADYLFSECYFLFDLDFNELNTSEITSMVGMFYDSPFYEKLLISRWNTQNVKDMRGMFYKCDTLTTMDIEGWDTHNVTDMQDMFYGCSATRPSWYRE